MLKILRKQKVAKKILYVLAAIIVPAFVLWGSGSLIRDSKEKRFAGKVFGKNVAYSEYFFTLGAWRNKLKMQFGDKASYLEKVFDPNKAVWDTIILTHEAMRRKIKISDKELVGFIASLPFLQKDGVFNQELYDLFLKYSLNTPANIFEEEIKQSLVLNALLEQVTKDIKVTDDDILKAYKEKNDQIKLSYIAVFNQDLQKDIAVADEQIKEYYDTHKQDFKKPLQINLNFIGQDYPKDATDQQKKEIEDNLQLIKESLENKQDLGSIESKFNLKFEETGFFSLGEPIPRFGWLAESTDILFGLEEGHYSEVILTPRGPYIFGLKEKRKDYVLTFEESKEEIKNKLLGDKSKELAKEKITEINNKIQTKINENPKSSLQEVADALSLQLKQTEFFSRESYVPGIGMTQEFSDAAFSLKPDQISQIIELPNGCFILGDAQLKEFDQKKFDDEKEAFKNELITQKKNEVFEEFADNLRAQAKLVDYVGSKQKEN